jgi:hypothetical protein
MAFRIVGHPDECIHGRRKSGYITSPIQPAHVASSSAATRDATTNPERRGWWSRMAPVLLLLVITPLVAEFLLGDVTLASLPALVLFIPLYGGGAVLISEVVRRAPHLRLVRFSKCQSTLRI